MERILTLTCISLILSSLLTCCAFKDTGHGTRVDADKVGLIIDGKTTKKEVLEMFGKPDRTSTQGSYFFYVYNYCMMDPSGKTTAYHCDTLQVTLDKKTEIVKRHGYNKDIVK